MFLINCELCWGNRALHLGRFSFPIAVLCRRYLCRWSWSDGWRWRLTRARPGGLNISTKKIENMKHELCCENCALHSCHFSFWIAVLCRPNLSRRSWGVGGRWMLTGAHDVTNHERCPKTWQCETWTLLRIQYATFWRCNSSDCSPLSIRFVSLKFQPRGGRFGLASV